MSITDPSKYKRAAEVPSNAAKDLSDNARVFDVVTTSNDFTEVVDRLGNTRMTLKGFKEQSISAISEYALKDKGLYLPNPATLSTSFDFVTGPDGESFFAKNAPYTTRPSVYADPKSDPNLFIGGYITGLALRQSQDRMMGYTFKGNYLPDAVTLTNEGDYVLDDNGNRWFGASGKLPYKTDPATYPNPDDDTEHLINAESYSTKNYVQSLTETINLPIVGDTSLLKKVNFNGKIYYAWQEPSGDYVSFVDNGDYGTAKLTTTVGEFELVTEFVYKSRGGFGGPILNTGYGIPDGADQTNLTNFAANFTARHNPRAFYPGIVAINNPTDGSVFDFASFGGQNIPGFNPIGFVYHHYSDSRMIQIDNVGTANEILYLKNANNPVRRADKPADYIGSGKFISLNRQESDGSGGVTGTLEGFFVSEDFELVWPMKATGINTARLWNNAAADSDFWAFELKNTKEQKYLFRIDNGGVDAFDIQYISAADNTQLTAPGAIELKAENGILYLSSSEKIKTNAHLQLFSYSRSSLPTLGIDCAGCTAFLLDGSDKYPIYWNGSAWLKYSDNQPA